MRDGYGILTNSKKQTVNDIGLDLVEDPSQHFEYKGNFLKDKLHGNGVIKFDDGV